MLDPSDVQPVAHTFEVDMLRGGPKRREPHPDFNRQPSQKAEQAKQEPAKSERTKSPPVAQDNMKWRNKRNAAMSGAIITEPEPESKPPPAAAEASMLPASEMVIAAPLALRAGEEEREGARC